MAVDHTRDFFQPAGLNPTDLDKTTLPLFLTRWITHFCAPVFVLLAGASAALYHRKRRDVRDTRNFLVSRGLWLMLLECTWVNFSWFFSLGTLHLGVLWAIGGAMILLSFAVRLPPMVVGLGGLLLTLALGIWPGPDTGILRFLLLPGGYSLGSWAVHSVYVIVPWFAVMACGYGLANSLSEPRRHKQVGLFGLALCLAFVALRYGNGYGDPTPWASHSRGPVFSTLSFLHVSKYPPSLDFLLMTLGPSLALVPLLGRWSGAISEIVQRFGRVALFFYLLHLPLVHALGMAYAQLCCHESRIPKAEPLSLPLIYAAWLLLLALLWWPCRQYDKAKHGPQRHAWMKWI
jgi:uncharacterized membrane protein